MIEVTMGAQHGSGHPAAGGQIALDGLTVEPGVDHHAVIALAGGDQVGVGVEVAVDDGTNAFARPRARGGHRQFTPPRNTVCAVM